MEGYILLFFTLKKWYWKPQTSHLRQGGGSVECFIGIIIHTTVLLPVSTWADDSPTHPFQMSQPDLYFKNSFPSGGMNRDIEQRHGLTYIIRHSVQMRSWEKMAPKHQCAIVGVTRATLWDEELHRERVGHHLKSVTKLQDSWGWFASLLIEVVNAKNEHKPP